MKFINNKILLLILFIVYNLLFLIDLHLNISNSFNGDKNNISNKNKVKKINNLNYIQKSIKEKKKKILIKGLDVNLTKTYYDRKTAKIIDDFFKNKYQQKKILKNESLTEKEIIKMFYILSPNLNIDYEVFDISMQKFFNGEDNNMTLKDKLNSFEKNLIKEEDDRFKVGIYYGK